MNVPAIEDLCNGSTPDSDSVCGGSNPSSSAIKTRYPFGYLVFILGWDSNRSNAICRWHIAATSSKTGGFFDFFLQKQEKCYRTPHPALKRSPMGAAAFV